MAGNSGRAVALCIKRLPMQFTGSNGSDSGKGAGQIETAIAASGAVNDCFEAIGAIEKRHGYFLVRKAGPAWCRPLG
jgi:hypothetical protein